MTDPETPRQAVTAWNDAVKHAMNTNETEPLDAAGDALAGLVPQLLDQLAGKEAEANDARIAQYQSELEIARQHDVLAAMDRENESLTEENLALAKRCLALEAEKAQLLDQLARETHRADWHAESAPYWIERGDRLEAALQNIAGRHPGAAVAAASMKTIAQHALGRVWTKCDQCGGFGWADPFAGRTSPCPTCNPHEGEHCQSCGRAYYPIVWSAPDDLWERVTGLSGGGGLRCPECFSDEAEKAGIYLQWRAEDLS